MKEGDREFEKLLKEAVCSYHKEKMDALPSEEELQDIQLSDDFYRKIDGLLKKQKHRWRYRFVRYGAVAACLLLFMSGTVGAAAYALLGAENFKTFFRKNARESNIEDSAVMNLEQLTDMAVTTVGTVYEDDSIRLDLKGLIKSGNRFSMILEGTLKQEDQIVAADGPQEVHQYGFLDTEINADQDLTASSTYYFREDDKNLKANQFVYMTTYSAETGFDSEQYEFMFRDFGYYQEDEMDEEAKEETAEDSTSAISSMEDGGILETPVATCSGTWRFTVDMDQAKDISYRQTYHKTISEGEQQISIDSMVLSPMGCSVYMTLPEEQKDSGKYFDNVHIRLKNGSLLSEECYEMGITDCELSGDEEMQNDTEVSREFDFEFRVPIDIRQVKAIEIFGESIEVDPEK